MKSRSSHWNTLDPEEDAPNHKWLCAKCGAGYSYLGQIAGTNVKSCQQCGNFNLTRFLYDVSKTIPGNVQRLL